MADVSHASPSTPQPPPAPPLPPSRAGGVFQKFIAPLSFNIGTRHHVVQTTQSAGVSPHTTASRSFRHLPSQTTAHRTGIPIAALDINKARTHAILAGQEILKTVHVHDGRVVEDFNLRSGINSYISAHAARSETANHRRQYLPAKDVVWSKGDKYDTIIATAALNGRIALYDVSRINRSRIELAWIHEHTGQVNKLDFDPTGGYLLLSGSQDRTVRIWDIREPQSVRRKQNINIRQPVRDVRWSPTDPGEFALCTENGMVQRWDLRAPTAALLSINAHEKECYAIDWHPDGRHLVSGGFDKYAKVWDFKSDNRRQKPTFSLRTPQAIMNVRWRPPCWSSDPTEKGRWQSSQLATSYIDADPRIHVWDLRRPLIPFREHDRYNSLPTDFLWASEHFLWSVGNQGMFQQTDVRYASLVHDELSTTSVDFMPNGAFISFNEDTRAQRTTGLGDAAAGFLHIPQERLSGGTDGMISRSLSDNDDEEDSYLTTSVRRQINRSSRSAKSQGNTPPTSEGMSNVVPLDRAVLNRNGLFNNEQLGTASTITGVSADPEVVQFLAENYAQPLTAEERQREPAQILDQLHKAFARNANICDYVSMHRTAQSWRILAVVVIPELKDWADSNRKERLENEAKRKSLSSVTGPTGLDRHMQSYPKLSKAKVKNNLFRGVAESEMHGSDVESTSNVTTPMAKPLPDSPFSQQNRNANMFLSLNETIEPIPPLPPSVVSAHSTAAAASRALFDPTSDDSPSSSPEQPRRPLPPSQHRRAVTDISFLSNEATLHLHSPKIQPVTNPISNPLVPQSPRMELRKQEDRRAAIRDFRAQQRQLLNFDDPIQSPRYGMKERHDSSESFPMFSASTDSSHRGRSLGQSLDLHTHRRQNPNDSEEWETGNVANRNRSPPSSSSEGLTHEDGSLERQGFDDGSMQPDFPMDETSRLDFGVNNAADLKGKLSRPKPSAAASMWNIGELRTSGSLPQSDTAASSISDSVFPFEEVSNTKKLKIYASNPIRRLLTKVENSNVEVSKSNDHLVDGENASSQEYTHSDFRPVDFTTYEPKLPFAWSALPLLCHIIAFDMNEGFASAQFSVHLLMHLYPFFFDPLARTKLQLRIPPPDSIAERLMRPDLSHRIIEGLFFNYYLYLKRIGLYKSMAEVRKICASFGFEEMVKPGGADQPVGASLKQDPFLLQASCSQCSSFMSPGAVFCQSCGEPRLDCPVCLQLWAPQPGTEIMPDSQAHSLWTFCQACGHGGHWSCMQEWMLQPDTEGECPTQGCGCDCGPGMVRQQRIHRRLADAETSDMIRGGRASAIPKKDPVKASHSPAVDKARDTLRNSDVARDSSGDERVKRSFSGRGSGSRGGISTTGGGGPGGVSRGASTSVGRRVRLVTPGEENEPSYSVS